MQTPESAKSRIAESTKSVANAALWLQRVVENPESRTFATERLEVEATGRTCGARVAVLRRTRHRQCSRP
jgi:hypothetical protein